MGSRIQPHSRFKGVQIYSSANTHPSAKTLSLLLFTEDIKGFIGNNTIKRFRYKRYDSADHTRAVCDVARFITAAIAKANPPQEPPSISYEEACAIMGSDFINDAIEPLK